MTEKTKSKEEIIEYLRETHGDTIMDVLGMTVQYEPQVVVEVEVTPKLFQPFGVVHGGVYVLMAETAASVAATLEADIPNELIFGMEINANHLRPASSGMLRAIPTPVHIGKTSMVFNIEVKNDEHLVCFSRCTISRKKVGS